MFQISTDICCQKDGVFQSYESPIGKPSRKCVMLSHAQALGGQVTDWERSLARRFFELIQFNLDITPVISAWPLHGFEKVVGAFGVITGSEIVPLYSLGGPGNLKGLQCWDNPAQQSHALRASRTLVRNTKRSLGGEGITLLLVPLSNTHDSKVLSTPQHEMRKQLFMKVQGTRQWSHSCPVLGFPVRCQSTTHTVWTTAGTQACTRMDCGWHVHTHMWMGVAGTHTQVMPVAGTQAHTQADGRG